MGTLLAYPAHRAAAHRLGASREVDRLLRCMSRQVGLHTTSGVSASAPASTRVKRITEGGAFPSPDAFKTAFERNTIVYGRQCKADKRVSGGKAKLYRCTGAATETNGRQHALCLHPRTNTGIPMPHYRPCLTLRASHATRGRRVYALSQSQGMSTSVCFCCRSSAAVEFSFPSRDSCPLCTGGHG